jgi:hypothetical protein
MARWIGRVGVGIVEATDAGPAARAITPEAAMNTGTARNGTRIDSTGWGDGRSRGLGPGPRPAPGGLVDAGRPAFRSGVSR